MPKNWMKYCIIVVVITFLFSCASTRPTASVSGTEEAGFPRFEGFSLSSYPKEWQASILYTEGLKYASFPDKEFTAKELFERTLRLDSLHAPSYFEIAGLTKDPTEALKYSRKACELDSTNTWFTNQLGRLYIVNEKYDSALVVYRKLLRTTPNNPENYRLLAALYEQQGQPFSAIAMLDSAENRFGMMEGLSVFKRQLLVNAKLFDKAVTEAKAITTNFPYDPANYVALAELYSGMGKDSLAMEAYDQALALSPNNTETVISLNEYYKSRGDNQNFLSTTKTLFQSDDIPVETKMRFFNEIIKNPYYYQSYYLQIHDLVTTLKLKYPDDERVFDFHTGHLIRTGKIEDALLLYKERIDETPPKMEVFSNIFDIEAFLDRPDSLAKYVGIAVRKFPDNPDLFIRQGSVLAYFLKDYKGANVAYEKALKLSTNDSVRSVIYGILGDNNYSLGNKKKSFKYYQKGLELDSMNNVIYNNYAYFLSEHDESLEKALTMSERAIKLSPSNPTYLDTYAWVLYKLGRYEDAKVAMRQAVSLDQTESMELFFHYGEILYALKEYTMAAFYWRKALEKGYDETLINSRLKLLSNPE